MLLALVVPVTINCSYFYWQDQILEKTFELRMKATAGPKNLVVLGFSLHDPDKLRWEHDHEFEYQGMMYDVVDRYTNDDSIYYHCWFDLAESRLKENLYRSLALDFGENPHRKSQESRIFSFLQSLINASPTETLIRYEIMEDTTVVKEDQQHYKTMSITPPTPPPKFA